MFDNTELNGFWDKEKHGYIKPEPFSEETLRETEKEIGYKYPDAYISLLRVQNGGCPLNRSVGDTGWEIGGIYGISKDTTDEYRSYTEELGCPKAFVPVCASAYDDDRIFLDYRKCGDDGEPSVVGVNFESNTINFIAKDFGSFIDMLEPVYDEDDEDARDKYDPYAGIEFTPVNDEQKKELHRALLDGLPWAIGLAVFFLQLILLLSFSKNIILILIRILSYFPAGYGIIGTIACLADFISKSRQTYESYVDTVDVVWEANEPLYKTNKDEGKKKIFLRLKKSKVERYQNTDGFKEGDRVRVYRPEKGEEILVKVQDE